MNIDVPTLTQLIQACFANAADGRFSAAQQAQFSQLGKQLRAQLIGAISTQFNAGTQSVVALNNQLTAVNTQAAAAATNLANVATTVANITAVVNALVSVIQTASVHI